MSHRTTVLDLVLSPHAVGVVTLRFAMRERD
jgi:hypothetical protein